MLGWRVALARVALFWEALWPALWPATALILVATALALSGWLPLLPAWVHGALVLLFAGGLVAALVGGLGRLRAPDRATGLRRIETASGLDHRPLSTLIDRPVGNDPVAKALWRTHLNRVRGMTGRLAVGWPRAGLLRRDPFGLRVAFSLLVLIAALDAGTEAGERVRRALWPQGLLPAATAETLDLWINPPAYTGVAPIFAQAAANDTSLRVPTGSIASIRVNGGSGEAPIAVAGPGRLALEAVEPGVHRAEFEITGGDRLTVTRGDRALGVWPLTVIPDDPPEMAFRNPPASNQRAALRIDYKGADDYGIEQARIEIRLVDRPDEAPIEQALGGLAGRREGQGSAMLDLSPHPWAGLPVDIRLRATDALGQVGESEPARFTLPERAFQHPVARAIVAQRKNLARAPGERRDVGQALARIAAQPTLYGDDVVVFLSLMSARARLFLDRDGAQVAAVQQQLWDTALRVEDGDIGTVERDLRQAEQALRDALDRGASDEEIQRLMDQLQTAMDRFLDQMTRQALERPRQRLTPEQRRNARTMTREDLQRMLDRAREAARGGQRDRARAMLDQLQQMMEMMQGAQMAEDDDSDGDGDSDNEQMQALQNLQDLARRQRELMDRGLRQQNRQAQRAQRNRQQQLQRQQQGQRQPGQQGEQGDQGDGDGEDEGDLAGDQEELRRQLGEAMRRLSESMGGIPRQMQRAEGSMRGATRQLRQGDPGAAQGPQGEALDQLRDAARNLAEQMQGQGPGQGVPGQPPRGRADSQRERQNQARDPLGRPMPNATGVDTSDVDIPEDGQAARAREIYEELRRRAADPLRPSIEREYIDRLMKRF
jgi:uncharacterized protein (TIGR02302 family)